MTVKEFVQKYNVCAASVVNQVITSAIFPPEAYDMRVLPTSYQPSYIFDPLALFYYLVTSEKLKTTRKNIAERIKTEDKLFTLIMQAKEKYAPKQV